MSHSSIAAKARKVETLLVDIFRAHWAAIYEIYSGGGDAAKARADDCLASDRRACLRIARRYYSPERAARFAIASKSEIIGLCWPWFDPFQVFVYGNDTDMDEIANQVKELVASPYVAMTWDLVVDNAIYCLGCSPDPSSAMEFAESLEYCDPPYVYPLPHLTTVCGDVYEAIVYSYCGQRLRVCKSVADPFLPNERVHAMDRIESDFLQNAIEEGDDPRTWLVRFRRPTTLVGERPRQSIIEAEIFGEAGTTEQRELLQTLKDELRANGNDYIRRRRARSPFE